MTDTNPEAAQNSNEDRSRVVSRRRLLASGVAASALAFGGMTGSVGAEQETGRFNDAPGRGGEAVVPEDVYQDEPFEITSRSGDSADEIEGVLFQCNEGKGKPIFLVAWSFEYTDGSDEGTLYTRSNNINTDLKYTWSDNGSKVCENGGTVVSAKGDLTPPEDFVQVSYKATGPQ